MIYIKDMDMPVACLACRISCKHESYMVIGRPADCPLEEAKTGDLIRRADAIEAVGKLLVDGQIAKVDGKFVPLHFALMNTLSALPSAEGGDAETNPIPTGTGVMIQSPNNGADLIRRADAIDAICKVWCYTTYGMCPHDDGYCKGCDEIEALDALPSAEAVSREDTVTLNSPISIKAEMVAVVRCKDCKHRDEKCGMGEHRWCEILKMSTVSNDFCSYGERREP